MNENLISQLVDMGFPINASKRAAHFSGGDLEAAMNWLCTNIDDPDYNTGTPEFNKTYKNNKYLTFKMDF